MFIRKDDQGEGNIYPVVRKAEKNNNDTLNEG